MAYRYVPLRSPWYSVPVTPEKWCVLCEPVELEPGARELSWADRVIGGRKPRLWYVGLEDYRNVVGSWPAGF